jgi:hypothetical protein
MITLFCMCHKMENVSDCHNLTPPNLGSNYPARPSSFPPASLVLLVHPSLKMWLAPSLPCLNLTYS